MRTRKNELISDELIKRIESGSIYNDLRKDYEELGKLIKLIDIYEKRDKDIA